MHATIIKRKKTQTISTAEQWEAITSSVRFEMYAFLEGSGPCSIADLAELMNVPADSLYHHIKILLKAEIVVETGYRKKGRQLESIYDVAAAELGFDLDSDQSSKRLVKLNDAVLRQCSRTMKSATENGEIKYKGANRNAYLRLETAWLSKEELAEVRQHIEAITGIFENGRKERNGQLFMACMALSPVVRNRRNTTK